MNKDKGYVSFSTFSLILLISTLIIAAYAFILQNQRVYLNIKEETELRSYYDNLSIEIIQDFLQDTTPEADSPQDLLRLEDSFTVEWTMEELSSRLNPNFSQASFWEHAPMNRSVKGQASFTEWVDTRLTHFAGSQEQLESVFLEEDWENLYSLYTPINVNHAPLPVIEAYLRQNGFSENSLSYFISNVRNMRDKDEFISQSNIFQWQQLAQPSTLLNSSYSVNVNFVDPVILEAILSYPWNGEVLDGYLSVKNRLLLARKTKELSQTDIANTIPESEQREYILSRLGSFSWFWRLTLSDENVHYEVLLSRIPSEDDQISGTSIQIVSTRLEWNRD